eukprot:4492998-Prymnesium_polylepis.1
MEIKRGSLQVCQPGNPFRRTSLPWSRTNATREKSSGTLSRGWTWKPTSRTDGLSGGLRA